MTNGIRKVIWFLIVLTVMVCFMLAKARRYVPPVSTSQGSAPRYASTKICEDALAQQEDHRLDSGINRISFNLPEGCFGSLLGIPNAWHNFWFQPQGDQTGWWVSIWIAGEATPRGPFVPNTLSDFDLQRRMFRLQGHGTILFYSNDVVPAQPTSGSASPSNLSPLPQVSQLTIHHTDPHICEKPAEAYYAETGLLFRGGEQGGEPPEFLFDDLHFDGKITWANGFKGKLPVCLLVDEKGNPRNVQFPQSPGREIEERIKMILMAWHFKGGYLKFNYDPPRPVPCEIAEMFTFE